MSLQTKTSDWRVAAIAQVGGGFKGAGGAFWFQFTSRRADARETFMFTGGGLGVGGTGNGASLTPNSGAPIDCDSPFSVEDLHLSAGRLTVGTVSFVVGYSVLWISAFNTDDSLFSSQYAPGWGAGVGAGAMSLVGVWSSARLASR